MKSQEHLSNSQCPVSFLPSLSGTGGNNSVDGMLITLQTWAFEAPLRHCRDRNFVSIFLVSWFGWVAISPLYRPMPCNKPAVLSLLASHCSYEARNSPWTVSAIFLAENGISQGEYYWPFMIDVTEWVVLLVARKDLEELEKWRFMGSNRWSYLRMAYTSFTSMHNWCKSLKPFWILLEESHRCNVIYRNTLAYQ